jgi:hypothetical protein
MSRRPGLRIQETSDDKESRGEVWIGSDKEQNRKKLGRDAA